MPPAASRSATNLIERRQPGYAGKGVPFWYDVAWNSKPPVSSSDKGVTVPGMPAGF